MQDRYPLTVAQLRKTKEDLATMQERAEEISRLMTAGYGSSDPKAIRAGELNSAIQRLQWELERSAGNSADAPPAGGGGRPRHAGSVVPPAGAPELPQRERI